MMLCLDSTQYTLLNSFIHLTWYICISRHPIISKSHFQTFVAAAYFQTACSLIYIRTQHGIQDLRPKKKRGGKCHERKEKKYSFSPNMLYMAFVMARSSSSKTVLRERPEVLHPWPGPAAAWSRWSSWRYRGTLRCSGRGRRTRPCWARPRGSRKERTFSGRTFVVFFSPRSQNQYLRSFHFSAKQICLGFGVVPPPPSIHWVYVFKGGDG